MNLVYDIYLVFSLSRWVGNLFTDLSYVVDTIVGCRIYLYNIQRTHQHINTSTSQHLTTYHHFTTNFLFFVMYTPGFSPSSDSPLERTFLPVRS